MPIFRVKSVKIYTGQKNLHEYIRAVRDKYQVCTKSTSEIFDTRNLGGPPGLTYNITLLDKYLGSSCLQTKNVK